MDELKLVFESIAQGGPLALASVIFYIWREERKDKRELQARLETLQNKVLDNTVAQTQAMGQLESSIAALKEVLSQVLSKMLRDK